MEKNNRLIYIIKLSKQAFGQYKLHILSLFGMGFLGSIMEGIGVNAVIPLFSFVISGKGGDDMISEYIEKFFHLLHIDFRVKYLLIFICILFILKTIVTFYSGYLKIKITTDYEEKTRIKLFKRTLEADWPYLLKQKLGHLETVLIINVSFSARMLQAISGTLMTIISLIVYIFVAINISLVITIMTIVLGLVLFLVFKPFIFKARQAASKISTLNKDISHFVNENIVGVKTIKTMHVNEKVFEKSKELFHRLTVNNINIYILKLVTSTLMQPISLVFICILFGFSYKVSNFNFAAFAVVIYLVQRISDYGNKLQSSLQAMNESLPYLNNILEYENQAIKYEENKGNIKEINFFHRLEFKNVNFRYEEKRDVLTDINFTINKGEMIGLIGPSGAGKTTIVDLILRLLYPQKGEILLDNNNIAEINLADWRRKIGYVSQDIFLTNDSIKNNIKFYNEKLSEEEIINAAQKANIYDFIESCPEKMETIVGERGVMLSVGQRQRIVMARVLAKNPQILILDEATSALDNESELNIQNVIKKLKGNITVFIIAHRLSTVINCDKIMVLDGGRIVEQGNPGNLLQNNKSYFYKIYNIKNKLP